MSQSFQAGAIERDLSAAGNVRIEDVLDRHRDFWSGKGLLVRTRPYVPVVNARVPLAAEGTALDDVYLEPRMFNPEDFLPWRSADGEGNGRTEDLPMDGDVFKIQGPFKIPWTEAIMGCPVKLLPESGASWSESFLEDFSDLDHLRLKPDNPWLEKLVDFTRCLSQHAAGRYFVTQATMRGPVDMADAMLGTERLCLMLLDEPRRVRKLLEICTETFIETARAQWAAIRTTCGGHVCRYGIWAPGQVTRTQADAGSMLSAELYRREILPFDLEVLRAFPYSIMHAHSAYPHIAAPFLETEEPSALQIGYDQPPFGPSVKELLPELKHILKHKPLIFHGVVSRDDHEMLCQELPPHGLLLDLFLT